MIMGDTCTRDCRYCNVITGKPPHLDTNEPIKIARSVKVLGLKYAVITSVTRDDLDDEGANHFAKTVLEIKQTNSECKVEILTPDFNGKVELLKVVLNSKPYVFNHNIEVVKSLFPKIRPQGNYDTSLKILKAAKEINPSQLTKSGMMIGIGETKEEIIQTLKDLKEVNVDIVTIGQYLQPRKDLETVSKYYTPEEFKELETIGYDMGFKKVFSAPLVRSSYHADEVDD